MPLFADSRVSLDGELAGEALERAREARPSFGSFLQSPEWFAGLSRHVLPRLPGTQACFLNASVGRRQVVLAPLVRDSHTLPVFGKVNVLRSLNVHGMLFADALTDPASAPEDLSALLTRAEFPEGEPWHALELGMQRRHSSLHRLAASLPGTQVEVEEDGGVAVIDTERSYADWESGLESDVKAELRRARRRAAAAGGLSYDVARTPAAVASAFLEFVELENSGWKNGRGALAGDPIERGIFEDLLLACAEEGKAGVHRLLLGGRLIGAHFWVWVGETMYCLKTTYSEEFAGLSPGKIMLADFVDECCRTPGVARMDFVGRAPWMRRFAARLDPTFTIRAVNHRTPYGMAALVKRNARLVAAGLSPLAAVAFAAEG